MDNKLIGSSIASLRQKRGWTQRQLARQMGVSHQAVSKWEKGESAPDVETLVALSRLFGVSIDRLLNPAPEDLRVNTMIFPRHEEENFDDDEDEEMEDEEEEDAEEEPEDDDEDDESDDDEDEDEEHEWHRHEHHFHRHHHRDAVKDPKLRLLMQMAPFMSREVLDEKFLQYLQKNDLENYHILESLAPFVSRESLSMAIDRVIEGEIDPEFVVRLAPFIGRKDLVRLIKKTPNQEWVVKNLGRLAPFLPREYIDEIVRGIDF